MNVLILILFATISISLISFIGGAIFLWKKVLLKKFKLYAMAFAAGVMLSTAFIDLLPEALHNNKDETIYIYGLLAVVVFFLVERFILWYHHHNETRIKPSAYLLLLGDGLHNFFDGLAIASAFISSPALGFITTLAVAAHEIPHEIADFSILIHAGMKKTKALFYNFISALTALLGAVASFYYLNTFEKLTPVFLMFSAGVFIYIALTDLIPDLHQDFKRQRKWMTTIPFLIGIIFTYFLITTLRH